MRSSGYDREELLRYDDSDTPTVFALKREIRTLMTENQILRNGNRPQSFLRAEELTPVVGEVSPLGMACFAKADFDERGRMHAMLSACPNPGKPFSHAYYIEKEALISAWRIADILSTMHRRCIQEVADFLKS